MIAIASFKNVKTVVKDSSTESELSSPPDPVEQSNSTPDPVKQLSGSLDLVEQLSNPPDLVEQPSSPPDPAEQLCKCLMCHLRPLLAIK